MARFAENWQKISENWQTSPKILSILLLTPDSSGEAGDPVCTLCSTKFSDRQKFNAHIRMHLKEKLNIRREQVSAVDLFCSIFLILSIIFCYFFDLNIIFIDIFLFFLFFFFRQKKEKKFRWRRR
jgi:hypothetical protein